jgi:hypothetical protein
MTAEIALRKKAQFSKNKANISKLIPHLMSFMPLIGLIPLPASGTSSREFHFVRDLQHQFNSTLSSRINNMFAKQL